MLQDTFMCWPFTKPKFAVKLGWWEALHFHFGHKTNTQRFEKRSWMALVYGLILLPHMNNLTGDIASTKVVWKGVLVLVWKDHHIRRSFQKIHLCMTCTEQASASNVNYSNCNWVTTGYLQRLYVPLACHVYFCSTVTEPGFVSFLFL